MVDVGVEQRIVELTRRNPRGLNIREIADILHINRTSVARYLEVMSERGILDYREMGKSMVYYKSCRISDSEILNLLANYLLLVNEHLEIIRANPAFLSVLGTSEAEIMAKDIRELDFAIFRNQEFITRLKNFMESPATAVRRDLHFMDAQYHGTHIITQLIESDDGRIGAILNIYPHADDKGPSAADNRSRIPDTQGKTDIPPDRGSFFSPAENAPIPLCIRGTPGEIQLRNRAMRAKTLLSNMDIKNYQGENEIPAYENPAEVSTYP